MSGSVRDPPPPPPSNAWEEQFFEGDIPGDIQAKLHSRDQTVYQEGQDEEKQTSTSKKLPNLVVSDQPHLNINL